jgi:DNA polymerase
MIVGEQPGDQEDRAGHPFVGPSGRLLDIALEQAGIDRDSTYVTNAVSTSSGRRMRAESAASTRRRTARRFARAIRGYKRRSQR